MYAETGSQPIIKIDKPFYVSVNLLALGALVITSAMYATDCFFGHKKKKTNLSVPQKQKNTLNLARKTEFILSIGGHEYGSFFPPWFTFENTHLFRNQYIRH